MCHSEGTFAVPACPGWTVQGRVSLVFFEILGYTQNDNPTPEDSMTEIDDTKTNFAGTYFDRDLVLKISRWARIFSWVILGIYVFTELVSLTQFMIQFSTGAFFYKGQTFVDIISFFTPHLLQPLPGFVYFFTLQAIGKALLILMDMEDNTRRTARK